MLRQHRTTTPSLAQRLGLKTPDWYWTWCGHSVGYRQDDGLFAPDGMQLGRFKGREVYGPDGRYLGESGPGAAANRLITNQHKKTMIASAFVPTIGPALKDQPGRESLGLYSGHEDFPTPRTLTLSLLFAKRANA